MSHSSASQNTCREPHGWCAIPCRVFEFFAAQWKSVLFSAAIAINLEHLGVLRVLTKFSWLVVSSLASQGPTAPVALSPGQPMVVLISNEDFITRYGEKSPLDRCTLADDIEKVLAKSPSRLAIDFDLSPLIHMSDSERQCQTRLDQLLARAAQRLVVLSPFPASTEEMLTLKHDWMAQRCREGVHFGDGTIEQSLGLVTEQVTGESEALKARIADQLHGRLSDHICRTVLADSDAHGNTWLIAKDSTVPESAETMAINFPVVIRRLAVLPLSGEDFAHLPSLDGSPVLLGGDWGRDDSFLTSIGTQPGVVIHGARLVSLAHPIQNPPPLVGLLSDIGIALCFAVVVQTFWLGYVRARRLDLHFAKSGRRVALSTLFMLMFLLIYLCLSLYFFFAAEYLFSRFKILIAPLLIALSILVDGFVSGPVEQIKDLLEEEQHERKGRPIAPDAPLEEKDWRLLTYLKWAALFIIVPVALQLTQLVDLRAWAGLSFIAAEFLLYFLLLIHIGMWFWRSRHNIFQWFAPKHRTVARIFTWVGLRASDLKEALRLMGPRAWSFVRVFFCVWRVHAPPDWKDVRSAGQLLAQLRALVFWAVLARAAVYVLWH